MDYFEVITDSITGKQTIRPYTPEEIAVVIAASIPTFARQQSARAAAYRAESDPLFFMAQRGKATQQEWLDKISEIEARFPYPEE